MILTDAGPLIALTDPRDPAHERARAFLRDNRERLLVPSLVVSEVAHFVGRRVGAAPEASFLRNIAAGRTTVIDPVLADYGRAADYVERYASFPLGTVDAVIAAMAERLGVTTLLTLDRRHFGALQPAHCPSFTIVP